MPYNNYSDGNLWDEKRKTEGPWQTKAIYSQLSLNGHLCKMDTSVKLELVPAFLYSFYLTLYKTDTSLRRTLSAGPKGVRLRES